MHLSYIIYLSFGIYLIVTLKTTQNEETDVISTIIIFWRFSATGAG
jgi:hypothetical protein